MKDLKEETQTIEYKIIRETSKYNKYIKWFVETYYKTGEVLSRFGYRTEKEARNSVRENELPIGNRLVKTIYIERS
jgi:hypothetical protein